MDVVRVRVSRPVHREPLSSEIVCNLFPDVFIRCLETMTLETSGWMRTDCGWVISKSEESEEPFVVAVDVAAAEASWAEEELKLHRMASAVSSALIRSYSLPRAKRLARSLWRHAEAHYPQGKLTHVTSKTIEDIMISLGGKTGLGKQELFEFIKAAASRHSNPQQAVLTIARQMLAIFGSRPSAWVADDLNVIITEDMRIDNNRFIMCAAEGNLRDFQRFLAKGMELTALHSELHYTALHAAADFGQMAILDCIIGTGISVNIRDPSRGQTALHFAAYSGRPETALRLIDAGADRTLTCLRGVLPYVAAAKQGHEECSDVLKFLPPVVSQIRCSAVTITSVTAQWKAPALMSHHAPIVMYAVVCCLEETSYEEYDTLLPQQTAGMSATFTSLLPSAAYKIRIKCKSVSGWSAWSAWIHATTLAWMPEAPEAVEIIKVSINGLYLRWRPPARDNGKPIDSYDIEVIDEQTQLRRSAADSNKEVAEDAAGGDENTDLQGGGHRGRHQGGVNKLYRLVKHKDMASLAKHITGLEPGRRYLLRCRAHNELGHSAFGPWCRPVVPQYGVTFKPFVPPNATADTMAAAITWFVPVLNTQSTVACYELQLCRLLGPITVTHSDTQEAGADRDAPGEDSNEYLTISSNILSNVYTLDGLKAGARYKCRVRPRIKSPNDHEQGMRYGRWLGWEHSMNSEAFSLPATVPDPPLQLMPCRVLTKGEAPKHIRRRTEADEDDDESVIISQAGSSTQQVPYSTMASQMTAADSFSSHFVQAEQGLQVILSGTVKDSTARINTEPNGLRTLRFDASGCEQWAISHNSALLTWQPGDSNGQAIVEMEVHRAIVRSYRCEDLLKLSALLCDVGAFAGVDDASVSNASHDENDSVSEESEPGSALPSAQDSASKTSLQLDDLEWTDVSRRHGQFLSPQTFRATDLLPGQAYCFKVRQRNSLGWSPFSLPSPVIGTYPSVPPEMPVLVHAAQSFVVLAVSTDVALTSLQFESQIQQYAIAANGFVELLPEWQAVEVRLMGDAEMLKYTRRTAAPHLIQQDREAHDSEMAAYSDLLAPFEDDGNQDLVPGPVQGEKRLDHVALSGLIEGQRYAVRMRRRTVLGWSPYSEASAVFRMQS